MKKKSIKVNAILNIIRVAITTIFPIIVFPYVSRILQPTNMGKVNFAASVISYFVLFACLGIPQYGIVLCAKYKDNVKSLKENFNDLLFINIILSVLAYILLFISIIAIGKFQQYRNLLIISSSSILLNAIGIDWLYTALEEFKYITIRSIAFKILSIILIFILVKTPNDYYNYAIITIISNSGSNILNIIHAKKYISLSNFSIIRIKRHIKPILTFFAASVASTINSNIDTVMIGFLQNDTAVGLYTFGIKIRSILTSLITAGLSVLIPRFSQYAWNKEYDKYRKLLRESIQITMFIAIGLSLFFILFSKSVIYILGGREYLPAQMTMCIMTGTVMVLGLTWSLGVGVLQPLRREQKYAKVMLIACIVNVTLNAIMIPFLGYMGAAIATLLTEILNVILFWYYSKDFLKEKLKKLGLITYFCMAIVAGIISIIICQNILSAILKLIIGFTIFSVVYVTGSLILNLELRNLIINQFNSITKSFFKGKYSN